nr:pyruvate formate lyase-activating protein [Clostridia bacterium]
MKNLIGKIHSFETLGAVDGPGIRFILFMQGCHLRCKYCHNRDTWDLHGGKEYTVNEIYDKIIKYRNYFIASNGGVTASGGEPLLQVDFLIELFNKLKSSGISTALDTSGMINITEKIKILINLTDLFLVDIKCINDRICKDLVGHSNKQELEFIKYLNSIGKEIWIRQVIVPTITDKEDDLYALRNFINCIDNITRVDLLPYHDLGKFKWLNLNQKYDLENIRTANTNDIQRVKKILESTEKRFEL